jgi:ribosome-associated toxin RatA of RatAB toxin-antitoxin module
MATQVQRERLFEVPVSTLFKTITDFEKYKTFLPEVVESVIVSGKGTDQVRVRFEIEVIKKFVYELDFTLIQDKEVRWKLVKSDFFKANQGKWVLTPEGNKTQVQYELEVAVAFLVPGWIAKKLTESSLPQMFDKFEEQAKKSASL